MPTPEKLVQNMCCAWLSRVQNCTFSTIRNGGVYDPKLGRFRRNSDPYYRKGVADVIGILNGIPLAIEFKSETGRSSPEQVEFGKDWRLHGGIYLVIRSLEQLKRELPAALLEKIHFLSGQDGAQDAD